MPSASAKIGTMRSLLFWLTCSICLHSRTQAFTFSQQYAENPRLLERRFSFNGVPPASYCKYATCRYGTSQKDVEAGDNNEDSSEMVDLILEISLEPSNEKRRNRLSLYLEEGLLKSNGELLVFIDSFQSALESAGNQVQLAAREKAAEMQQQVDNKDIQQKDLEADKKDSNNESSPYYGDEEMMSMGKSDEERRLWALVDMMVQSKIMIKKAAEDV